VFKPLLEKIESHWSLLVVDLHEVCFLVYDSLRSATNKNRQALMDSAVSRNCYLWLKHNFCVSFEPTLMSGVNYVTHVVVNVGTGVEDCVSAYVHTVEHLR